MPDYPRGDFKAYTNDGYIINMQTSGDYNKNIPPIGNNHLLGAWIKGKMEQHGALMRLHPFNLDVLENYGKDSIKFYKISEGNYYIKF